MSNIQINPYAFAAAGAIFEDDFSTDKWSYVGGTQMSYDAGNSRMNFALTSNSTEYAYVAIPAWGSDSWYLEYTIYISSTGGSGNTGGQGIYSSTSQTSNSNYYGTEWSHDTSKYTYTSANSVFGDASYSWSTGTSYFVKISVNSATNTTVNKAYPSAVDRTNDTNAFFSQTTTPPSNEVANEFLRVGGVRPTNGFSTNGYLKDFLVDLQ